MFPVDAELLLPPLPHMLVPLLKTGLGLLLLYVSRLLYETEQAQLTRGLETSWVLAEDFRTALLRTQQRFVGDLASFIDRALTRWLGGVLSRSAVLVSLCVSMASLLIGPLKINAPARHAWTLLWLALAAAPIWLGPTARRVWEYAALAALCVFFLIPEPWLGYRQVALGMYGDFPNESPFLYLVGLTLGVASDFAFFVTMRTVIRWNARRGTTLRALCLLATTYAFPIVAFRLPFQLVLARQSLSVPAFVMAGSNRLLLELSDVGFMIALVMSLNHVLWALVSHLIYRAMLSWKNWLLWLGLALVASGHPRVAALLESALQLH